ncbi:hypothetical protein [Rhodalgimonas zhirmunskyi]|uniref:Excalibur calcium-binding domain-containing protein n=1 Tax=Rhodalgimonas zhirmunskyi TaxID=2964767 RepID=A0AAJ1U8N9_9RHOB|nr:hypothetical protein [Rhodoalgimonas zhirmunskyi]MDQ2094994.1 hypothetical protein [Rhodoalgimonas zhirmunskyi]
MRFSIVPMGLAALLALAACDPTIPDSGVPDPGAGVGFGDYAEYQKRQVARDAALQGQSVPAPSAVSGQPLSAVSDGTAGSDVAADTAAVLAATRTNSGDAPLDASPSNPPPVQLNNPGISDENDFATVSAERSRQDDAARQAALKQNYTQIQPTALPSRAGAAGPNIVAYALASSNGVGQSIYKRSNFNAQARYQKNCAKYASPDLAQEAFLASGGPQKDKQGLDPDGDGFACAWDPAPFRKVKQ